jgi:hypothetical protein
MSKTTLGRIVAVLVLIIGLLGGRVALRAADMAPTAAYAR